MFAAGGGFMSRAGYFIALMLVGWVGASDYGGPNGGRWRDPANWRPTGVPGAGGTANVSLAPDGNFIVNMDFRYSLGTALSSVTINSSTSSTLTVNAVSDLFAVTETIGDSGLGTYTQSTAINSVSGSLYLGNLAASSGTYNLSGSGSLNVFASEYVGNAGTGIFTQSGGTHTVGNCLPSNGTCIVLTPLSGAVFRAPTTPGLRPGLLSCAPSGAEKCGLKSILRA